MSTKLLSWVMTGESSNYADVEARVKRLPATLTGYRRVPVNSDYPALMYSGRAH
jgi:hypothetical protein